MIVRGDIVLHTKNLGQCNRFSVNSDITLFHDEHTITVLAGFETDGASVPRRLWDTIGCPFSTQFITAAIFHDILYQTAAMPKEWADEMFYQILLESGVSKFKSKAMRLGVKLFGKSSYGTNSSAGLFLDLH